MGRTGALGGSGRGVGNTGGGASPSRDATRARRRARTASRSASGFEDVGGAIGAGGGGRGAGTVGAGSAGATGSGGGGAGFGVASRTMVDVRTRPSSGACFLVPKRFMRIRMKNPGSLGAFGGSARTTGGTQLGAGTGEGAARSASMEWMTRGRSGGDAGSMRATGVVGRIGSTSGRTTGAGRGAGEGGGGTSPAGS